ncbi:MAG: SUMF1/EgtB/PvdO family nonheme iron enzyme [Myxococcales bacterium]|nr:SUMF1/EgtB/PvdO family nonheme iron enzyme [Myxococcales bacterium]
MTIDLASIHDWIWNERSVLPHPATILDVAEALLQRSELDTAASLLDRAWGSQPAHEGLREARQKLLDHLSITEHAIHFRYVPAGVLRQGSEDGDADERPRRRVELDAFWIAETPLTWLQVAKLGKLEPPPSLRRKDDPDDDGPGEPFIDFMLQRIISIYSVAKDLPPEFPQGVDPSTLDRNQRAMFARPPLAAYDKLPAVGMSFEVALAIANARSSSLIEYTLPSEAQWERAARGGLPDARYPWGDSEPTPRLADFDRFEDFSIRPVREFAPNGYGLFGVVGTCFEWCTDLYDALAYQHPAPRNPVERPAKGTQRVARGGSWADCPAALTVSFRGAFASGQYFLCPTVGMRPIRTVHR